MGLEKLFRRFQRFFNGQNEARSDEPIDPVRDRLRKFRKDRRLPDCRKGEPSDEATSLTKALPEGELELQEHDDDSTSFPKQEAMAITKFAAEPLSDLDANQLDRLHSSENPVAPVAPTELIEGESYVEQAAIDPLQAYITRAADEPRSTIGQNTAMLDGASFRSATVPCPSPAEQGIDARTEGATVAGGASLYIMREEGAECATETPNYTDQANQAIAAHKRRPVATKTLLALRIKQELARSQEIARIRQLAFVDERLGKRFETKRNRLQAQTMKLDALAQTNQSPSENKTNLEEDINQTNAIDASDLLFIEPLTLSPLDTLTAPNETDDADDGKILAQEWGIQPDLILTGDGSSQSDLDGQAKLCDIKNHGSNTSLFADFDTTANLPTRSSSFEKFSESSLKALAGNPRTPARILSWLASHSNPEIRALVARNRSALPETIWLLAKDYDESVRLAIAEYLETDRPILKMLSEDGSPLVAWRAKNSLYLLKAGARGGTSVEQMPPAPHADMSRRCPNPFKNLVPDRAGPQINNEEINFLKVIAQKPSTPPKRLADLAKHTDKEIRALVAENANTPLETLWYLAKDSTTAVKLKLADNYNCPIEIIEALQDDKDLLVSRQARNILVKLTGQSTQPNNLAEKPLQAPLLQN